jgi:hypothetical protein
MPGAEPAERVVDRREPGPQPATPLQRGLELGEGEVGHRLDQPAQGRGVGLEQRPPVPTVARGGGAARRPDPLHQLDRG